MYSFESRIRYSEIDKTGKLSLTSLINYFQDCSNFQSVDLGLGYEVLKERGKGWVLSSWHIEIYNTPKLCETVTIGTFASGFKGFYGNRNFMMLDEKGDYLACADSLWVLIDKQTGRPTKPAPEDIKPYGLGKPLDLETEGRKIKEVEESRFFSPFKIQKHHLDTHEHVNNSQYIQMAMEVIPEDIEVKKVRAEYKKSALYGDVVIPKIGMDGSRTVVELCDEEGQPYALIEVKG